MSTTGSCVLCDHGWRAVAEPWVESTARLQLADGQTEPSAEALAALRNSVYPCSTCSPRAFYRWAGGHWERDHEAATCPDCIAGHTGRPKRHPEHEPPIGEPPVDDPTAERY